MLPMLHRCMTSKKRLLVPTNYDHKSAIEQSSTGHSGSQELSGHKKAKFPQRLPEDAGDSRHIIDILLEERCERLHESMLWPIYRSVLYPILRYSEARQMADAIIDLEGHGVFDYLSDLLTLNISISGLHENVPSTGKVIIASTHPTGIADGIAMYDALKNYRPDQVYYANRDALRAAPQLEEIIIPVEWVEEKRTRQRSRETLIATKQAFADDRCLVIFPSGKLAYMRPGTKELIEQDWMISVVNLARKYKVPVVPVKMIARNSWLYYWFRNLGKELRDITLFNELLNKREKPFELIFGKLIPPEALTGDPECVTSKLRQHADQHVIDGLSWEYKPLYRPSEKLLML